MDWSDMSYHLKRAHGLNRIARRQGVAGRIKSSEVAYLYEREFCVECHSTEGLELDHIIPYSQGGDNVVSNLQFLCKECHVEKSRQERWGEPKERFANDPPQMQLAL